jgi:hypothetical protein
MSGQQMSSQQMSGQQMSVHRSWSAEMAQRLVDALLDVSLDVSSVMSHSSPATEPNLAIAAGHLHDAVLEIRRHG